MKNWKCCLGPGPGWTIHRLKEHIHRKHSAGNYQCHRCRAEFENNSRLEEHQRSATPCPIQSKNEGDMEKIDAQQALQLKKKSRRMSDEEKWFEIYRIVFQPDATEELPSPYYENLIPAAAINIEPGPVHRGDSLSEFQLYLQHLLLLQGPHTGQQNAPTIQATLGLIQGYRETAADPSLVPPLYEAPSLVFDQGAFSTTTTALSRDYYQTDTSNTLSMRNESSIETSPVFEDMDAGLVLSGPVVLDTDFEARFNETFGLVGPDDLSKPTPPIPPDFGHYGGFG